MNDEIKEILSLLNSSSWSNEAKQIEDYITNLQQENHELKSKLECYENGIYYSSKVDELEQENDNYKAQKYITDFISENGIICEKNKEIDQLTNNWNELEEWLKEYMRKNENWYTNELSTYDKQYYGDTYYTTNAVLMTILDKMKEIKNGDNHDPN